MIWNGQWRGQPLTLNARAESLTISLGTPGQPDQEVYSFDGAGRPWSVFRQGVLYRRGLNGRVLARWRENESRQRRWLPDAEARALESLIRARMVELEAELWGALPGDLTALFTPILNHDAQADMRRCAEVYQPVGILPPDQYLAAVLQLTEGCSFNTCTFCTFYKGRPFRIKPPDELRAHALAVRDFLGAGLRLRRSIFLGDANALVVPMPRLLPLLDVVREVFDVEAAGGLYAFLDGFSGEKKSQEDYRALAGRGLRRVYVGLESGSDALLHELRKPGSASDAIQAVREMKAGGVAVGVIVLIGAGGQAFSGAHVRETIQVLNAMPLDGRDLLYLSDLVIDPAMAYAQQAAAFAALDTSAMRAQEETIRAGLHIAPRISRYDIREFIY